MRHRLYYLLKPYVPRDIRVRLRRVSARRILRECGDVWPILEVAGATPPGWRGWPDHRQFAVVLTHDVEGTSGLKMVRTLAEIEQSLGFRSSFNFVPEGEYSVSPDLRQWLTDSGFEVGVHDLHHDGRLYDSREGFRRRANRINHYLASWNARGFRSGFMRHNLDWIHDLEILYDASTFDTDPLEPQPDGVGTIFPFWVPRAHSSLPPGPTAPAHGQERRPESPHPTSPGGSPKDGYVELPYTLPQDSTLFHLLMEPDARIWRRKVDWIAERGGMVLVNVHPDYLHNGRAGAAALRQPERHYRDLLHYLKERYRDCFWHALPHEVASWYRETLRTPSSRPEAPIPSLSVPPSPAESHFHPEPAPAPELEPAHRRARLAGRRAAVLLYSYYPADPRPRRAAEALVQAGMQVDLFCLSENPQEPRQESVGGVNVFRLRMKRRRDNKLTYLYLYGAFLLSSFVFLARRSLRVRYDLVHVHNMPDFLVFSALAPRLFGARVILDLHDPMPELMMSIYSLSAHRLEVRALRFLEKASIAFSHLSLTPNVAFRDLFVGRGCPPAKMQIVMNSPEESIFAGAGQVVPPPASRSASGEFRLIHHGSLVHRHGIDILIEAVALVKRTVPGVHLDIYGSHTDFLDTVMGLAKERNLEDCVAYHGPKPQSDIATAISQCDLGIIPNRRSAFTEINFPTRLFEYLSMGRPVIAPDTKGIRDYFSSEEICFFEPGSPQSLAHQILWVRDHPAEIRVMVERGRAVYRTHLWSRERARFIDLVDGLFHRRPLPDVRPANPPTVAAATDAPSARAC